MRRSKPLDKKRPIQGGTASFGACGTLAFRHRGAHRHRATQTRHGEFGDFADPQQRQQDTGAMGKAWDEVSASFDRFCLSAGVDALGAMMEKDAEEACGARHVRSEGRRGRRWGRTRCLLPPVPAMVHPRLRTPYVSTIFIEDRGHVARRSSADRPRRVELPRPFRTPDIHVVAPAGAALAVFLMLGLPVDSWIPVRAGWSHPRRETSDRKNASARAHGPFAAGRHARSKIGLVGPRRMSSETGRHGGWLLLLPGLIAAITPFFERMWKWCNVQLWAAIGMCRTP
jgi:hypothetical protein